MVWAIDYSLELPLYVFTKLIRILCYLEIILFTN